MADASTPAPDQASMPVRFLSPFHSVRAVRFDGSRGSAAAITAKFPGRVAWSVERDGVLLALAARTWSGETLIELAPGSWLVELERWHANVFVVLSDDHFREAYKPARYQDGA